MFLEWMYSRPETRQATKNPTNSHYSSILLTRDLLSEVTPSADVITQIAARQIVHHKVEVLSVLESIVHVDYEDVVQLDQNLAFVDHRAHASFCDNPSLAHLFHSV
jgi:hypothetical protein